MVRALIGMVFLFLMSAVAAKTNEPVHMVVGVKSTSHAPLRYNGTLHPFHTIDIIQPEHSTLKNQYFVSGDRVKKNQLLLEWSSPELLNQLYQAKREYLESKDMLLKLTHWDSSEAVIETKREADYTSQQCNEAKYRLLQTKKLYQAGIVSKEEYRMDERNYHQAKKQYQQALTALEQISQKGNNAQKNLAKLKYDVSRQRYHILKNQVEALSMRSPIDGIVIDGDGKEGQAFATLIDTSKWMVEIKVSEKDALVLQSGQVVNIQLRALGNQTISGKIAKIGFQPVNNIEHDHVARYPVTINIDPSTLLGDNVLLGMSAMVICEFPKAEGLFIPKQAITSVGDHHFVNIAYADGTWQRMKIEIGTVTENEVQVTKGLKEGDHLVMFG